MRKLVFLIGLLLLGAIYAEDPAGQGDGEVKEGPQPFFLWDGTNSGIQGTFVLDDDVKEGEDPYGDYVAGAPQSTTGHVGSHALMLEEVTQIVTLNDIGDSLTVPFTISLWLTINQFVEGRDQILFEYADGEQNILKLSNNQDNKFVAKFEIQQADGTLLTQSVVTTNAYNDEEVPIHLVLIVDSALGGALFVNGVQDSTNVTEFGSFAFPTAVTRVTLGASTDGWPSNILNGIIDDFRRYPEAISDVKLAELYCPAGIPQYGVNSCQAEAAAGLFIQKNNKKYQHRNTLDG